YVSILVRLGEVFNPVEIGIIAPLFLSASYTKGMMKFVDPLGVHSESFLFEGIDKAVVVQIELNNQMMLAAGSLHQFIGSDLELAKPVLRAEIFDGMD